jgi:hypothetical protein
MVPIERLDPPIVVRPMLELLPNELPPTELLPKPPPIGIPVPVVVR